MKILAFPQDTNPYQELLYAPMRTVQTVTYLTARFDGPWRAATYVPRLIFKLVKRRLKGYKILHIHWLFTLGVPTFLPGSKQLASFQTKIFLESARLLGFKLVWTAHNVLPHTAVTSNDLAVRQWLGKHAHAIITHNTSTITALNDHGINTSHCHVIPHGSYIGVYPDTINKTIARQQLQLTGRAKVVLFFGAIHPYKNLTQLLLAWSELARNDKLLHIVIAGRCSDTAVDTLISSLQVAFGQRIRFFNQYIADEDIQVYMRAADVAVFPFTEITTSGSVLLACSFGLPIIAPAIGALRDIPDAAGVLYNPREPHALREALMRVLISTNTQNKMGQVSREYAEQLRWPAIATATTNLYAQL